MKKALIIADLFYASPRIPGLVKYLPKFGWQPIILTTPFGHRPEERLGPSNYFRKNHRVIETFGYTSKRRIRSSVKKPLVPKKQLEFVRPLLRFLKLRYKELFRYPDLEKGWKPVAVKVADELLQSEDIDAMISSSSPVTTHIITKELKEKHNIPWIADFRDLWTQNHNYPYTILRKMFEKRLELKTLSTADALVTVSPLWTEKLSTLHKKNRVFTITNGFDPEKMSARAEEKADLKSKFTIIYTGQIYTGKQDPSKLLSALKNLISNRTINPQDIEVRFYGRDDELLSKKIKEYGLSAVVKQYGIISRETSFEKQRESQVLLLLNWEDPQEKGVIPGKVFEYLAAQKPILATGGFGNDVIEALLNETNSGTYCSTIEDIKNALKKYCSEYKLVGKVAYNGNLERINKYSYREMAKKFAEILDSLVEEH